MEPHKGDSAQKLDEDEAPPFGASSSGVNINMSHFFSPTGAEGPGYSFLGYKPVYQSPCMVTSSAGAPPFIPDGAFVSAVPDRAFGFHMLDRAFGSPMPDRAFSSIEPNNFVTADDSDDDKELPSKRCRQRPQKGDSAHKLDEDEAPPFGASSSGVNINMSHYFSPTGAEGPGYSFLGYKPVYPSPCMVTSSADAAPFIPDGAFDSVTPDRAFGSPMLDRAFGCIEQNNFFTDFHDYSNDDKENAFKCCRQRPRKGDSAQKLDEDITQPVRASSAGTSLGLVANSFGAGGPRCSLNWFQEANGDASEELNGDESQTTLVSELKSPASCANGVMKRKLHSVVADSFLQLRGDCLAPTDIRQSKRKRSHLMPKSPETALGCLR